MNYIIEESQGWQHWVKPAGLRKKPIHRWCVFPHSFTSELVHSLIDTWKLNKEDHILDPFSGAGTTILAAKEIGIDATGYDISPFAVHVGKTKIADYDFTKIMQIWKKVHTFLESEKWDVTLNGYPTLVQKALPGKLLSTFDCIKKVISRIDCSKQEKDFFLLALIETIPEYSRAIATGGWLSWVDKRKNVRSLPKSLTKRIELMIEDVKNITVPNIGCWRVGEADARKLPDSNETYSAVITSPPYPNRHDYSRVFGVELMFGYLTWEETRSLRYQSFESHPESHPNRPNSDDYTQPRGLKEILTKIKKHDKGGRIKKLLEGYFLDMYICFKELKRVCKPNAKIAFVLGNAQYFGVKVPVDELTAEIGEIAGLNCEKIMAVRYRGNSSQQMAKHGRHPSRESIIQFLR